MAFATRSLARSGRFLVQRGPRSASVRSFSVSLFQFLPEDPVAPPPPKESRLEDIAPMSEDLEHSPEQDLYSKAAQAFYDKLSPDEQAAINAESHRAASEWKDVEEGEEDSAEIDKLVNQIDKQTDIRFEDVRVTRGFWAEDDGDEFAHVEDGDEEINDDEITSFAHAEMELHREFREYARITAWDMPMLSKLAQPFTLPPDTHILRFRYTTYMGEQGHPAEPKVVVEVASRDLTPKYLTEAQRQTFLKLVGTRYNPQTDVVKMSCEKFQTRAQNKRYLGDLVNSLIMEAKEGETFSDIPLDLRHHKPKIRVQFPESWKMTKERRQQLAARRAERLNAEKGREAIVDGSEIVAHAVKALPEFNPALKAHAADERDRVAVKVGARPGKKGVRR